MGIKKILKLFGKDTWSILILYIIYAVIYSLALYVLSASGCQFLLDGGLGGDWLLFKKGLYYISLLFVVILIILPTLLGVVDILIVRLEMKLRNKIFEHILNLPISFFESHTSSGIVGLILNNLEGVSIAIKRFFSTIGECVVFGVLAIYFLIDKGFIIGVFMTILAGALTGLISLIFVRKIRRESDKAQTKLGGTNHVISAIFDGICCEKIYNISDVIYKDFNKSNYMYTSATKEVSLKNNISLSAKKFIGSANYLAVLIIGILLMIKGQKTIGEVMAILSIASMLYYSTTKFLTLKQETQHYLVCTDKIIDFLSQQEERDVDNQLYQASHNSLIQFKDVSFQYRKGNTILKDLTLDINTGEKVNLVGYSGNGKSTVVKLILGFYKNYQGSIKIDGFEIKDTSNEKMKGYISYVSQENLLFNSSIMENLQYGNLSANYQEIIEVTKDIGLHDFIMSLPQKYDTVISFDGGNLSRQQCSKLAIARAILKKAPIVILDEAMAKINPKNEAEIKAILDKLTKGKTVINIAHKLDSIAQHERIIIFEKGRIVEDGIKKELLEKDSILRKYLI